MKKFLYLLLLVMLVESVAVQAEKGNENSLQKKSEFNELYGSYPDGTTYPMPFNELNNSRNQASPSTGYYFYDNGQARLRDIEDIWRPKAEFNLDTGYQSTLWTRILPGPRIVPKSFWEKNPKGKHFFRNPADMINGDIYDPDEDIELDTTTNAIAGPMPLGISGGFYFNGIRYDSFYVAQTGVIALTNRRYIYDSKTGQRSAAGGQNCYDVYSQDWFITGKRAREDGDGINDPVRDDFGFTSSVLGRNPYSTYTNPASDPFFNKTAGLRHTGIADIGNFTSAGYTSQNCKPALIAPFWGNVNLSQYDEKYQEAEDYGKVYFKTTENKDALIINFYNASLYGNIRDFPAGNYNVDKDSRPGANGYCEWDASVIISKVDSSIVFVYTRLSGESPNGYDAGDILRGNTMAGILGWGRTTGFDSKNPDAAVTPDDPYYPWASEYKQYTHYYSRNLSVKNTYPKEGTVVKFKQWKNTLRAVNMLFRVRDSKQPGPDISYDFMENPIDGTDYELLAGEPLIGAIQPVGLVQNLTNDVQGPDGINFTAQDIEFKTTFEVTNIITGRKCKSTQVPVKQKCFELDGSWEDCNNNTAERVRLVRDLEYDNELRYKVTSEYKGFEYENEGYTGLPPYKFANVTFSHFEPNEYLDNHVGRMNCRLVVVPTTPEPYNKSLGDQWPFDDTVRTRFFVIRRIKELNDDATEFHVETTTGWAVPSVLNWVSTDAYVVDGDIVSMHALPPRGSFVQDIPGADEFPTDTVYIKSPVIEMNRTRRVPGQILEAEPKYREYETEWGKADLGGDEMKSFPLELAYIQEGDTIYHPKTTISFSVQRAKKLNPGYLQNYSRFIGEQNFIGPEAKIFYNNNGLGNKLVAGSGGSADMLVLEFAKPSDDGLNGICNVKEEDWRHLPYRRGTDEDALDDMSVLTVYGGGGYLRGFLQEDPDSTLPYSTDTKFFSQDENDYYSYFLYDEGLDWNYRKYVVQIPDTFINWQNMGANTFRFRFKVLAKDHSQTAFIPDDYDDFYIDNINVQIGDTLNITDDTYNESVTGGDLEFSAVRIDWPYTAVPATQATAIPILTDIANNSADPAGTFSVKVRVFREEDFNKSTLEPYKDKKPVYCRIDQIANLQAGEQYELVMPPWDVSSIQKEQLSNYILVGNIIQDGEDVVPENDMTFFEAEIRFDEMFAYDPIGTQRFATGNPLEPYETVDYPVSDVDQEIGLNIPGRGLNLSGESYERGGAHPPLTYEDRVGDGIVTNVKSGKFAMKFELLNTDTIRGYQAYFTPLNSTPNDIEFEIISGSYLLPGQKVVAGSKLTAKRMKDPKTGEMKPEQYITYELDQPVELKAGTYWLTILQMETDGINLGATSARSGLKVTNFFQHPQNFIWATSGNSLYMDKHFREKIPGTEKYVNKSLFAYVNANYSDNWVQFTPTTGAIGYPHTNHQGLSLKDGTSRTYMNGSWLPMFRPYFGDQDYGSEIGTEDEYEPCPDIPVELVGFRGAPRKGGIELNWETASETDNHGFEIQRRLNGETTWNIINFVSGNGTTVNRNYYNYFDNNVEFGNTYQYKLRQLDKDGTAGCAESFIVTVAYDNYGGLVLGQNQPNPFSANTSISFTLPSPEKVRLEVIDMFGNTVRVLDNTTRSAGSYTKVWDGRDDNGNPVAPGTYLYRLTAGDKVQSAKMTLIK